MPRAEYHVQSLSAALLAGARFLAVLGATPNAGVQLRRRTVGAMDADGELSAFVSCNDSLGGNRGGARWRPRRDGGWREHGEALRDDLRVADDECVRGERMNGSAFQIM